MEQTKTARYDEYRSGQEYKEEHQKTQLNVTTTGTVDQPNFPATAINVAVAETNKITFTRCTSDKIRNNLRRDNPKSKESVTHINGLKCPSCGKDEAFAYVDSPMAIMCHRNNECGETTPIKQVYPELWQDLSKQYPPTFTDKKATARAYLESRGLNANLIEFNQGYKDKHQTVVIEHDGVTFHRLIDYTGKGKNRLTPYQGKAFESEKVKDSKSVFVTEGIFEALSLDQSGCAAIATYSSGSLPKEYYQANADKEYILAFNNDTAGVNGIKKTIKCFDELGITNYKIALTPKGKDWNDLLVNQQLSPENIEKTLDKAYWQGKLTFAKGCYQLL
jgi:Toprim-like